MAVCARMGSTKLYKVKNVINLFIDTNAEVPSVPTLVRKILVYHEDFTSVKFRFWGAGSYCTVFASPFLLYPTDSVYYLST